MHRLEPHALLPLPHVYEQTHRGERALDVWSRLLLDRIVFLGTEVTSEVANAIIAQLLFLESEDPDKAINLYINSPGGDVAAGLAIYDTMNYIKAPVATLCAGRAMSMGAVLLAAGAEGQRAALPHASILIHQPLGGARGQASDIEIHAREIVRLKDVLSQILVSHTGQDVDRVKADSDRDFFMTAEEALEYGIIDRIVTTRDKEE
ncbi:MAG TPA: ATP-dependent Clp protease proteolytic subunit [Deltaproteobacteria bacterium]|nr:ATP-dependent Clp protease proteolytic subunit [Deltaproteobacteria bacterium]HCP44724.1 ATP-dependent Clp protease proteolytic subunit [Deltaproteobacteria bacterium]|tara:strand:- start:206 stop:823 length:618 start_codon:yes stop_codon:yes gene_type:complete